MLIDFCDWLPTKGPPACEWSLIYSVRSLQKLLVLLFVGPFNYKQSHKCAWTPAHRLTCKHAYICDFSSITPTTPKVLHNDGLAPAHLVHNIDAQHIFFFCCNIWQIQFEVTNAFHMRKYVVIITCLVSPIIKVTNEKLLLHSPQFRQSWIMFWVVYLPLEQNSHRVCGVLMNPEVRALWHILINLLRTFLSK